MTSFHFTREDIDRIHRASLRILHEHGVIIANEKVQAFFRNHGFKVDGSRIYFSENQVVKASESVPSQYSIRARNPEKNLAIGCGSPILCGTGGEVYIVESNNTQRLGTMEDYKKIAQLVQTSPLNQMTAHESVHPHDIEMKTSHLDMMGIDLTSCDVAATSSTQDIDTLQDCLELIGIVFGGRHRLLENPSTIGIVSPLSPLQYSPEQAEILMILAENRQPAAICNMLLLGSSAPLSIPAGLALLNAELLAGIVLSQLVSPGTPIIYGSTSCPLDMKNGGSNLGSPETLIVAKGVVQLAGYYGFPCRTGGALTDSHLADGQAMAEGALNLYNAIVSGADYILHAFGMLSSFLATSLEKWVMDEEICRSILAAQEKIEVNTDTLELDSILNMGSKGEYLTHHNTYKNCRKLHQGFLGTRHSHNVWLQKGGFDAAEQAQEFLRKRLGSYQKPDIDIGLEQELNDWIEYRKKNICN